MIGKVSREEYERQRELPRRLNERRGKPLSKNVKGWIVRKEMLKLSRRPIPRKRMRS